MKMTFHLLVLISFALTGASGQDSQLLVTPQWVNDHLNDPDLVLLQVTFLQFEYDKEHIAGARYLWPGWLAPDSPFGSYNCPDPREATRILRQLGVSRNSKIVLYHIRNEVSVTARMFLTLEHLGLKGRVFYLNGGMDAWKKSGFSVTNVVPVVKKGNIKVMPGSLLVGKDYVLNDLSTQKGIIVDARMQRFYDGDPTGNPRDGHIAGAKNIPYTEMVDAANLFKPEDQLQAYFTPVAPDKSKEIVVYCFIGQTASVVYMAGRILGYDMKLYDGSMQEWSRIDSLPMEVTKK
jgi:thiosulfate/3-mercaptopyruvate sulfurtransferase